MAIVNGTAANDFIHRAGDGLAVPAGYIDITGVTVGNDAISGLEGNDILLGDRGDDALSGLAGDDQLFGSFGNDILEGGPGNDAVSGGPGADAFVIRPGFGHDTITDFSKAAGDKIAPIGFSSIPLPVVSGANSVFDFGNGDVLTLIGVTPNGRLVGIAPPSQALGNFGTGAAAGGWVSEDLYPRQVADVNGDGRADIVGFGEAGAFTALGQTNGTFAAPIQSLSALGASPAAGGWTSQNRYPRLLGDVNGDGRADIVGFGEAGAFTVLGQADGSFAATPIQALNGLGASAAAGGWTNNDRYPRLVGDVNGDGRADIVAFGEAGASVALGQANGTFASPILGLNAMGASAAAGGWVSQDRYTRLVGDVNGDGRADIVAFGEAGTFVALGQTDGTFGPVTQALSALGASAAAGGFTSQDRYPRVLGDVNGDGSVDIVAFGEAGTHVALGTGAGGFSPPALELGSLGTSTAAGGWTSYDTYPRFAADVNGDSRADIVGFGFSGVSVALSQDPATLLSS